MGARISKSDGLIELPCDIQCMILGYFDVYNLLALTFVNKQFRREVNARLWRSFSITESCRFLCPMKDNGYGHINYNLSRLFLRRCEFIARKPHIACHVRRLEIRLHNPLHKRKMASLLLPFYIRKIYKALMATPNLKTLVIYANPHLQQISSYLSANAHKFPFKLRVIESNLIYRSEFCRFLEFQPQIEELGECRPDTDLYLEVPHFSRLEPYLPRHVLPSLRIIRGSIHDIRELAPDRPVNSILIHQAYDRVLALTLEHYDAHDGRFTILGDSSAGGEKPSSILSIPNVHTIIESDHSRDKYLPRLLLHWNIDLCAIQKLSLTMARLPDLVHFPVSLEVFPSLTEIQWINRNEYTDLYRELAISTGQPTITAVRDDLKLVRKLLDAFILACVASCPSITRFSFAGYFMYHRYVEFCGIAQYYTEPMPIELEPRRLLRDKWGSCWKMTASPEKKVLTYEAVTDAASLFKEGYHWHVVVACAFDLS